MAVTIEDVATIGAIVKRTGKVMKLQMTKVGDGHWRIRGEADIDAYYDRGGAWRALTGKLDDGSKVEYRRV